MFIELIVLLTLCYIIFVRNSRHPDKFPPGPRVTVPFFGQSLPMKYGVDKMRERYGDVFGMWYGPFRAVYACDFEFLQELSASPAFTGRFQGHIMKSFRGGTVSSDGQDVIPGILHSQGTVWSEQRRFTMHALRDSGLGRNHMERLLEEEVARLCGHLLDLDGKAVNVTTVFSMATINTLWRLGVGKGLEYRDEDMARLAKMIDKLSSEKSYGSVLMHRIDRSKFWSDLLMKFGAAEGLALFESVKKMIEEEISEHRETFQEESLRDFLDYYIDKTKKQSDTREKSFSGKDGDLNMQNVLIDFFFAGIETTTTTLRWAMVFLLNNPDILEKVQLELEGVTGSSRLPGLGDRESTPYTEAVIHETQRLGCIVPSLTHKTVVYDIELCKGKYFIPANTCVIPHLESIMKDPKHFPDPHKFDPGRFIGNDGKFKPHPHVIPFFVGKRRCVGEIFVRASLYMFLTGILSRFHIQKTHPSDYLSQRPTPSHVAKPYPFKMVFLPK